MKRPAGAKEEPEEGMEVDHEETEEGNEVDEAESEEENNDVAEALVHAPTNKPQTGCARCRHGRRGSV